MYSLAFVSIMSKKSFFLKKISFITDDTVGTEPLGLYLNYESRGYVFSIFLRKMIEL